MASKDKQMLVPKKLIDNLYKSINSLDVNCIGCKTKESLTNEYKAFDNFRHFYLEKQNKAIKRDLYKRKLSLEKNKQNNKS